MVNAQCPDSSFLSVRNLYHRLRPPATISEIFFDRFFCSFESYFLNTIKFWKTRG